MAFGRPGSILDRHAERPLGSFSPITMNGSCLSPGRGSRGVKGQRDFLLGGQQISISADT